MTTTQFPKRRGRSTLMAVALAITLGGTMLTTATMPSFAQQMTDVGTPRAETLIVDMLNARVGNPTNMNMYQQGVTINQGYHQMAGALLYDIDTAKGSQIPDLAAEMPVANADFTVFKVALRQGLTWSDGQPFSADDVVFTDQMIRNTPALSYSSAYAAQIASVTKVDDNTVEITTTKPTPRLAIVLGSVIYGNPFHVVPKHVWEKEDAATFTNFPPVTISAYKYKDSDPNGTWFLWEKREDWQNSDVGQIVGEPAAKYVLFRSYGTEERRVLAMAANDIDILTDISPESLDILRSQNPKIHAWFNDFPYANLDDPCERGMHFNTSKAPYDDAKTRWALALAINAEQASIATFSGMLRASPIAIPPTTVLMDTYHKPMAQWLAEFTLEDGYKPFDPDYAVRLGERLRSEGAAGIPEDPEALRNLLGVGWWKHDPEEATKLLKAAGFTNDGGPWLKPDGTPFTINILAPADFEVESQRLAFAVANEWTQFGVPTQVQQMQAGAFFTAENTGDYEVGSYWGSSCAITPDLFVRMEGWHKDYVRDNGTPASSNQGRYVDDELSALIDKLRAIPADDPQIVPLGTDILKELVQGLPVIEMFGTSKFVPVNETYWTNYPSAENYYEGPWWWWSNFKFIAAKLKPAAAQ
ncbi:MAG: extracellular solute-binding protein family 5 [Devosia sp.]|uniref:ABC transporter substrate-binding protein n=1 Tax=Devosia sp. TaxID=1871048 RepID=UPI00262AAD0D|nr:ABC transporter substrate-binding protein [Devosia sp.]MDB5529514.1 extracellular solute-binding protein family 5 [Devosia sp.]